MFEWRGCCQTHHWCFWGTASSNFTQATEVVVGTSVALGQIGFDLEGKFAFLFLEFLNELLIFVKKMDAFVF